MDFHRLGGTVCGGDSKLQIQNSSSTRVYPINPGGGTPIMILRQYVYVASINALFASSIPNKITPFQYKRILSPHFIQKNCL